MSLARWTILVAGCSGGGASDDPNVDTEAARADVTAVRGTGDDGALTVYVTIRSDETGCDRYADWWEVLTPDGDLVYRRILDHSHPDDNPFERSGGPVSVATSDEIVVRAHLHPVGYVGTAMKGTLAAGLVAFEPADDFATAVETAAPLPDSCLF